MTTDLKRIRRKRWIKSTFKKTWKTLVFMIVGAILLTLLSLGIKKGQAKPTQRTYEEQTE